MLKNLIKRARKSNKGFTLVELIVVIVILAIIIGVTIGGIYKYVGQSRVNTDKNNISAIESALSTLATDDSIQGGSATITVNKDSAPTYTPGSPDILSDGSAETDVKAIVSGWDNFRAQSKPSYTITITSTEITEGEGADAHGTGVYNVTFKDNLDGDE